MQELRQESKQREKLQVNLRDELRQESEQREELQVNLRDELRQASEQREELQVNLRDELRQVLSAKKSKDHDDQKQAKKLLDNLGVKTQKVCFEFVLSIRKSLLCPVSYTEFFFFFFFKVKKIRQQNVELKARKAFYKAKTQQLKK